MSKKKEKSLELVKEEEQKEEKAETQEVERKPSRKIVERVLSFDAYFVALMRKSGGKIQPHHKAPMKSYAKQHGKLEATEKEFDRLFRLY